MKNGIKKRILALVLCISMILPMVVPPMPVYSVEAGDAVTNYGATIGAVAEFKNTGNVILGIEPISAGVMSVSVDLLPTQVVIKDYYYDEVNDEYWYQIDSAPGNKAWPTDYADYHWAYADDLTIIAHNGTTGVFDANGNAVSSVTLPLYERIELCAESSLQGSVKYQWQIEYEDGKWVDIYGEDGPKITLSIAMIATLLVDDSVNIRCVSTSASKTAIGQSIPVTVDFSSLGDGEDEDDPVEPTVPTLEIQMNGVSADSVTTTYGNYDFEAALTASTTLSGTLAYKWEVMTDAINDRWSTLSTEATCTFGYGDMHFKYYDTSSDISTIRLTVSNGTDSLTDTFAVYRVAEVYVTNSTGDTTGTVNVTVSGSLPDDTSLNLGDASDTTIGGVEADEIALALDVTITQYGSEWQPAEGETVRVSIPASQLGLSDGQYFTVYHIHDGTTELLGPFKVENGYVTFELDGFSVVVISTNYGAAIGGVAEFADSHIILDSGAVNFEGTSVWTKDMPEKVVIKNYVFDDYLGKLFYEIDAAPGYTWPAEYAELHWCYSHELSNIDVNGSMGMFDENGEPVSYIELAISDKPTYTVQTSLTGDVKYQWQICYDVNNYLWMDIDGQNAASVTLSYAMLASVVDENGMCAVRCIVSNALKTQEGYPMVIAFKEDSTEEPDTPPVENNATIIVNGEKINSAELGTKYDEWDETVGEYVPVEGGSLNLSVNTNLTGDDVTYQWQGLSGEEWVTLSTSKDYQLTFSDLMFAGAYSGSTAYIRVVVTQGETVVQSEQLIVTIVEAVTQASTLSLFTTSYSMTSAPKITLLSNNSGISTVAEETNTVLVTVQFVMGNNTAPIENGLFTYNVPYNGSVSDNIIIPEVQGYAAYLGDDTDTVYSGTYALNLTNVTENTTITFRLWPAEVDYKVVYMQQNVSDDGYTIVRTDELKGLTGSDPVVENVNYEGFVLVWCSTDKIASDGSTVIEVKYDRLYFKMLFDLDGGYGVQPVYARYGTPVTVNNPTKAGYNFMGWNALNGPYNTSNDEKTAEIGAFTNIAIPAEHTNYKAIWKASDAAKVTVVVWGQKADNSDDLTDPNSYAYMSKTEGGKDLTNLSFQAKPGTLVTYNPTTGGYICGYTEEHIHGEGDCVAACGKIAHTHSAVGGSCYALKYEHAEHTHSDSCYACGQVNHNHTTACYSGVGRQRNPSTGMPSTYSEGYVHNHWYYDELIYIDGSWYEYSGSTSSGSVAPTTCGKTEGNHTHSDACGYKCDGEHTHTDDCYERTCGTEEHTHEASCYAGCTKEEHTHSSDCSLTIPMESNLWEFDHASTVTVAADGTSTLNVYYRRKQFTLTFNYNRSSGRYNQTETITARWGQNISKEYTAIATNAGGTFWSETDTPNSYQNTFTNYIGIMPKRNITYYNWGESGSTGTMTYYGLSLEGDYEKMFSVPDVGGFNVTKEDRYEFEGFTYDHGTDLGEECGGAEFYYTRNRYNLVFENYGTTFKNESALYEAPLSGYAAATYKVPDSLAPAYYQPGSVEFAGWYAAPQTPGDFNFKDVQPFDFANSTMPASDLKLYAWWKPVSHQVTFYYDYAALQAGTVYTIDGEAQTFPVPHGSKIQDPYTPPKDPTSSYYEFEGWAYRTEDGTETLWDFENSTVTGNVQLYGKWKSTTPAEYSVYFVTVIDGQEVQIAEPEIGMALGGTSKTFDAKFNEDLYEGYQDRYYPRVMSHMITINLEDTTQNTFTFYYDYVEYTSYTVKYLEKETGKPMSEIDSTYPAEKTVSNNSHAMVTETFVAIPGYLPDAYQKVCKIDPDGTNEIIFYYTKDNENGLWTVHYWLENLDGTYTEAVDMLFTGTAKAGSTVTAPTDTVIENYYYYAAHENNVSTGMVSIDAVTHLHMYYNRTVHDYTVQYLEAGTNKELADEKVVNDLKWGTIVTELADDENVAVNFDIYQVYGDAEKSLEISVDETENVITFYYTEKRVTLNYAVVGPDGTVDLDGTADFGKIEPNSESLQILSGKASGAKATAEPAYKFVGWYDNAKCEGDVLSTEATFVPTKKDGELWDDGTTYYAKFEYNLTSLTIVKDGADEFKDIDPNQSFVFDIYDGDTDTLITTVTVNSTTGWKVVVDGLTVGKRYKVTEKTDWSWRYNCTGWGYKGSNATVTGANNVASIELGLDGTITFTNERSNEQWLDGDSWCNNIFK